MSNVKEKSLSASHSLPEKSGSHVEIWQAYKSATGNNYIPKGAFYVTLAHSDSTEFTELFSQATIVNNRFVRFCKPSQVIAINNDPRQCELITEKFGVRCICGDFNEVLSQLTLTGELGKGSFVNYDSQSVAETNGTLAYVANAMQLCSIGTFYAPNICLNLSVTQGAYNPKVWTEPAPKLGYAKVAPHIYAIRVREGIEREMVSRWYGLSSQWKETRRAHTYICSGKFTVMATLFFYRERK